MSRSKFILYIEDDPDQLELVQTLLEREMADVLVDVCCSASGAEALLNQRCYDVVILDVALPGELGTDIAAAILGRDPGQAIYLMSEYSGPVWEAEARRVGLELQQKFSRKSLTDFVAEIKDLMEQRPCDTVPGTMGKAAEPMGPHGKTAATRRGGDVAPGNSAEEISKLPQQIRLTSPNVQEARAAIGKPA